MSSFNNVFQIAKDMNGPPGLVHPLLVENYAWVDERLREMYNGYALTASNCDEYEAAGLLKENYAWVDASLAEKCEVTDEDFLPCPLPLTWGGRDDGTLVSIEDESSVESYIGHKRKRSESDISDCEVEAGRAIKRLRCQSPIPTGKFVPLFSNPFCNLDCERYKELGMAMTYEEDSVSSLDLESKCGEISPSVSPNSFSCIDHAYELLYAYGHDFEWEQRFTSCPTPPVTINGTFEEVHVVTDDEESVYYDTDYDCDGYDSP
jgi:hypothetical protein